MVVCGLQVPSESAVSVARGIFGLVQPGLTVILAGHPAHCYSGPGDPEESDIYACLQSDACRGKGVRLPSPFLPSGDIVAGLPAALLSYAQVRCCLHNGLGGFRAISHYRVY